MRPHLSLDVRDVPRSAAFYERVFDRRPQKQTADYAKFDLDEPGLNLSLVSSTGAISSVNHLGLEVESADEVATWRERLQQAGIAGMVQENIACCFARQDKFWFTDPDGNDWEVFTVHEQLAVTGPLSQTGCCVPKENDVSDAAGCAK